jgi:hypothetical protein
LAASPPLTSGKVTSRPFSTATTVGAAAGWAGGRKSKIRSTLVLSRATSPSRLLPRYWVKNRQRNSSAEAARSSQVAAKSWSRAVDTLISAEADSFRQMQAMPSSSTTWVRSQPLPKVSHSQALSPLVKVRRSEAFSKVASKAPTRVNSPLNWPAQPSMET